MKGCILALLCGAAIAGASFQIGISQQKKADMIIINQLSTPQIEVHNDRHA